jgi:hypothetical protein
MTSYEDQHRYTALPLTERSGARSPTTRVAFVTTVTSIEDVRQLPRWAAQVRRLRRPPRYEFRTYVAYCVTDAQVGALATDLGATVVPINVALVDDEAWRAIARVALVARVLSDGAALTWFLAPGATVGQALWDAVDGLVASGKPVVAVRTASPRNSQSEFRTAAVDDATLFDNVAIVTVVASLVKFIDYLPAGPSENSPEDHKNKVLPSFDWFEHARQSGIDVTTVMTNV